MLIIPVIDILESRAVRGLRGQRDRYEPIATPLCPGSDPVDIAHAFREHLGLSTIYVADLDAILHCRPNTDIFHTLAAQNFNIVLDAGIRTADDAQPLFAAGATAAIVGLETCRSPEVLKELVGQFGSERIWFSLDLQSGQSLATGADWQDMPALEIATTAIRAGIDRLILLDLAAVGSSDGPLTVPLSRQILAEFPTIKLITGGGLRQPSDFRQMADIGVAGVLVASALHSGQLNRATVEQLADTPSRLFVT